MIQMFDANAHCILVAGPHHGLSEGVRGLLATVSETIVMVADEASLFECATRMQSDLLIADLSIAGGAGLEFVRRIRRAFPRMKLIVLSGHDGSSVSRALLDAGANAFVAKRSIATDLLPAADMVFAGGQYVSPGIASDVETSRGA